MNNITPANWLRATGRLRVILLVIALIGKVLLYIFNPPYFISKQLLIIPFRFLVALDVAWVIFASIVIVECIRVIAFRATSSWTLKKHFAVTCALIAFLFAYYILIVSPKTSVRYHNHGWVLAEEKEYQKAIQSLDISVQYNAKNIEAYLERGYVNRRAGNFEAALGDCNKAIDVAPYDANAYACRGHTYYYLGDYQKALEDWNKAINLDASMSATLDNWIKKVETKP